MRMGVLGGARADRWFRGVNTDPPTPAPTVSGERVRRILGA